MVPTMCGYLVQQNAKGSKRHIIIANYAGTFTVANVRNS